MLTCVWSSSWMVCSQVLDCQFIPTTGPCKDGGHPREGFWLWYGKKTRSKEGRHIVSITQFLNVFDDLCLTGFPKIHWSSPYLPSPHLLCRSGGPALSKSAAYPRCFADWVADEHLVAWSNLIGPLGPVMLMEEILRTYWIYIGYITGHPFLYYILMFLCNTIFEIKMYNYMQDSGHQQ